MEPSHTPGRNVHWCNTIDPAIPFLNIRPEETLIQRDTCTPIFIVALFTIAKTHKQAKYPSTDE